MLRIVPQDNQEPQEQAEIEYFVIFRFMHALGVGIKNHIKSRGCCWNVLHKGWICPMHKEQEVKEIIEEAKLEYIVQTVPMPKGMVPTNTKIAACETRLDMLECKYHKADMELLRDVYHYDSSLRPDDFSDPPSAQDKSPEIYRIEMDFYNRRADLQKMQEALENTRKELAHLKEDEGEKIFDPKAPLLIADELIQQKYLYQGHRTLQYCSNEFLKWDGIKYVVSSESEIRKVIYDFLRDAKTIGREGHLENFNPDQRKVNQVIDALRAVCHQDIHPSNGPVWLDGRKGPNCNQLIIFRNGLLNLQEWMCDSSIRIQPHTPLLLNMNALAFDFDPNAPLPQEWVNFLHSIWEDDLESQHTLQEWFGYILTHDTSLHKILLLVGVPRSGKGTIGRVLHALLGAYNVVGPTLSGLGGDFGLQPLLNKMLATISDARLNAKRHNNLIIERLLSISGKDPLTVNRKYLSPLTAKLPTRIVMMTNELPDLQDASGALAKRFIILTMRKSWLGYEDITLFDRLCAELPGILLWALQGLIQLKKRGRLLQPQSSSEAVDELAAMTSPIQAFIAARYEIKPHAKTPILALYESWCDWCKIHGYLQPGNIQTFGKNLRAAFPEIGLTRLQEGQHRERFYKGIILKPSAAVRGHEGKRHEREETL